MNSQSSFLQQLSDNNPRRIFSLSIWNNSLDRRSHLPRGYNNTNNPSSGINNNESVDIQSERPSRRSINVYHSLPPRHLVDTLVSLTGASRYECIRILSECDGNIDEAVNIISMNNRDRIRSSIRGTNRIGGLELLRNLAMEIIHVPNSTENPTENPTENSSENSKKEETKESLSETLDILREMSDNESKMTEGKYLELSNLLMKIHKNIE